MLKMSLINPYACLKTAILFPLYSLINNRTVHVTRNFTKSDEFCRNSVQIPYGFRMESAQLTSVLPCYFRGMSSLSVECLLPFRGTSSLSADRLCPYPRNVNASAVLRTRFVLVRICTLRGLSQAFPQTITFNNEQQRLIND